jgi:hypothetical protein
MLAGSLVTSTVALANGYGTTQEAPKCVCRQASAVQNWQAVTLEKDAPTAKGDFDYKGPKDWNGKPTAQAKTWCEQNKPKTTPPAAHKPPVTPPAPTVTPAPQAPQTAPIAPTTVTPTEATAPVELPRTGGSGQ